MGGFLNATNADDVSRVHLRGFQFEWFNVPPVARHPLFISQLETEDWRTTSELWHTQMALKYEMLSLSDVLREWIILGRIQAIAKVHRAQQRNQSFFFNTYVMCARCAAAYIYLSFDEGNINNVNNLISFHLHQWIKSPKNRVRCVRARVRWCLIWFRLQLKRIHFLWVEFGGYRCRAVIMFCSTLCFACLWYGDG